MVIIGDWFSWYKEVKILTGMICFILLALEKNCSLFQILPVNIKGLAGSVATLVNWLTSFIMTMTANLLLTWNSGG